MKKIMIFLSFVLLTFFVFSQNEKKQKTNFQILNHGDVNIRTSKVNFKYHLRKGDSIVIISNHSEIKPDRVVINSHEDSIGSIEVYNLNLYSDFLVKVQLNDYYLDTTLTRNYVKDLKFKILSFRDVKSSDVVVDYGFFSNSLQSLSITNGLNIKITYKNKKDSLFKLDEKSNVLLSGVGPDTKINIKAYLYNNLISDTTIKTSPVRFVRITKSKKVKFGKDFNCKKNTKMFLVLNGASVDASGNFIGSYVVNGSIKKAIKMTGEGDWFYKNGIIGLCEKGKPFLLSGTGPYLEGIDYYSSGLATSLGKVVLKESNNLLPVIWFIQNGPILIQNGKNNIGKNKKEDIRSAIGFDGRELYYILSLKPITLFDFTELMVKKGIDKALSLSGGGYSDNYGNYGNFDKNKMKIQFFN